MQKRLAFHAYRMLSRFAEVLPERAIPPLSVAVASVLARAAREQRQTLSRNLAHVLEREPRPDEIRASYASYVRYWLESLRLPIVPGDRLDAMISIEGREHVETALAAGKGCILALPHLGNWDVAGAWFVRAFGNLTVVVEEVEPPELFVWFKDFRESLGVNVVTNDASVGHTLSAALRRNETLALLCDRDVDGTGAPIEMFGEVTTLPRGPATLALRTGAALVPVAVYEKEDGLGYHAVVSPTIATERTGPLRQDVNRVTVDLTRAIEDLIRRAPTQWHVFQPNWPNPSPGKSG